MSFLSGLFNRSAKQGFVPQPVIPVRYYAGKHDNDDIRYALAEAVWLMSQVPTGRMLLQSMKDHGKQYVTFDKIEKGVAGTYSPSHHSETPFELDIGGRVGSQPGFSGLLSTLIHESAHARQDSQGIIGLANANRPFFRSATDVLRYGLAILHAKEAEALAMEIQVFLELSQIPLLKKRTQSIRPVGEPQVLQHVQKKMKTLHDLGSGKILANAFKAYYQSFGKIQHYQDRFVEWNIDFVHQAKKHSGLGNKHLSDNDKIVSPPLFKGLKTAFNFNGMSYLNEYFPDMDLLDPLYSGINTGVKTKHKEVRRFLTNIIEIPKHQTRLRKYHGGVIFLSELKTVKNIVVNFIAKKKMKKFIRQDKSFIFYIPPTKVKKQPKPKVHSPS